MRRSRKRRPEGRRIRPVVGRGGDGMNASMHNPKLVRNHAVLKLAPNLFDPKLVNMHLEPFVLLYIAVKKC